MPDNNSANPGSEGELALRGYIEKKKLNRGIAPKTPVFKDRSVDAQYGGGMDYWLKFIDDNVMQFRGPQQAAEAERAWVKENADAQYQAQADNLAERERLGEEQRSADAYRKQTQLMRQDAENEESRMDKAASYPAARLDKTPQADRVVINVKDGKTAPAGEGTEHELYRKGRK